jgi:photosystem II stability/assembly factor-like uncharacterized protein
MRNSLLISLMVILIAGCSENRKPKYPEKPLGWEKLDTPTKSSLRGLSPLTEKIIWASGSNGTWLRTLDGGLTWDYGIVDGLDSVDFRDIEAIDANTAIVISAGQPAVIYKTNDGGKNWEKKFQGTEFDFYDGMAFHKKRGYVIGDVVDGKWILIETRDEGENWSLLELSPSGPPGGGSFAASGSSILVDNENIWFASAGKNSKIYHSRDNGYTWEVYFAPIIQQEDSHGIFSMTKLGGGVIVAVGGDFQTINENGKNLVISADQGQTWRSGSGTPPSGYRSGVQYFPRFHWLVTVGPNGTDFSKDGGDNWEKFSNEGFHAVKLDKTSSSLWASGSDGRIARLMH